MELFFIWSLFGLHFLLAHTILGWLVPSVIVGFLWMNSLKFQTKIIFSYIIMIVLLILWWGVTVVSLVALLLGCIYVIGNIIHQRLNTIFALSAVCIVLVEGLLLIQAPLLLPVLVTFGLRMATIVVSCLFLYKKIMGYS